MSVSFLCSYPLPNYGGFTKSPEATAWNRKHSLNPEVPKSWLEGSPHSPRAPGHSADLTATSVPTLLSLPIPQEGIAEPAKAPAGKGYEEEAQRYGDCKNSLLNIHN